MGSIKDQIWYQSKFLKQNHHIRSRQQDKSGNPFAFKGNGRILSKDYKIKVKTELCKSFMKDGKCTYGSSCAFAHGEAELQKKKHVPSRYKTKLCQQFHDTGSCAYGERCQFIHSDKIGELVEENGSLKSLSGLKFSDLGYRQMLVENRECLKQRLISSQNPFINEFNLVYKDLVARLPIFELITSGQVVP
jgi:hypothetical protein